MEQDSTVGFDFGPAKHRVLGVSFKVMEKVSSNAIQSRPTT